LERNEPCLENIGLSLREAKQLLAAIQAKVVEQQATDYVETQRPCPRYGRIRGLNGSHPVTFQTLFGNLELRSPRWNHCGCQPNPAKTFSPLSGLLKEHASPERLYLEAKWASLISFELAAHLLKDALPVAETVNAASLRNHLGEREIPGGLQATTDANGSGRPDSLVLASLPHERPTPQNLPLSCSRRAFQTGG
jgi:hypothetical protein